jgi:hypothetical protein
MLDWSVAFQHLNEVNVVVAEQLMKSDHQRRLPLVLASWRCRLSMTNRLSV